MEGKSELRASKNGKMRLKGWIIALGIVAVVVLAGYICCTVLS